MESLDKKLEKLEEKVSKDLKVSFEILKENQNIIKNTLIVPFSTYLICGDYVFPKIYNEARMKDENECVYITEKIISRSQTISDLGNKLDLPDNLKNRKYYIPKTPSKYETSLKSVYDNINKINEKD